MKKVKDFLHKFYTIHYQRWQWYIGNTEIEYSKLVRIVSPTLILSFATWLKVNSYNIHWWQVIITYLILNLFAVILGKFLADIGIIRYNNKLANKQNEELMEIVNWVRKQK